MAEIVTSIGTILTAMIGWFGDVFTMIVGNDLFMALILIPLTVGIIFFVIRIINTLRSRSI